MGGRRRHAGGGVIPYDAAAFASKASPPFQADCADAELLKLVLRDLDSICERALWRTRGHAPASLEKEVHMPQHVPLWSASVSSTSPSASHVLCGVRHQGKLQEIVVIAGSVAEPVANQTPLMSGVLDRDNAVANP